MCQTQQTDKKWMIIGFLYWFPVLFRKLCHVPFDFRCFFMICDCLSFPNLFRMFIVTQLSFVYFVDALPSSFASLREFGDTLCLWKCYSVAIFHAVQLLIESREILWPFSMLRVVDGWHLSSSRVSQQKFTFWINRHSFCSFSRDICVPELLPWACAI